MKPLETRVELSKVCQPRHQNKLRQPSKPTCVPAASGRTRRGSPAPNSVSTEACPKGHESRLRSRCRRRMRPDPLKKSEEKRPEPAVPNDTESHDPVAREIFSVDIVAPMSSALFITGFFSRAPESE